MAYAQWIAIKISSENMTLSIRNTILYNGKFHEEGNKDGEIKPFEINKIDIKSGETAWIFSSGREDAAEGTKGRIDLYHGDTRVGIFDWNCPWGIKTNSFNWWRDASEETYITKIEGGNRNSGAIGQVSITSIKL